MVVSVVLAAMVVSVEILAHNGAGKLKLFYNRFFSVDFDLSL